jgi:hypothetical protein
VVRDGTDDGTEWYEVVSINEFFIPPDYFPSNKEVKGGEGVEVKKRLKRGGAQGNAYRWPASWFPGC